MKDRITSAGTLAIAAAVIVTAGFAMTFFYAPLEADQGFIQKIFYLHVPLAIWALIGFIVAGIYGIRYLRTNDPAHDARSYVLIHQSVIFATTVLITGSIWAKAAWGKWWVWDEPTLVSFLIVFLLYCTYQPLRFSIEDPERQSRYAAVFAVVAGAFVPLNFIAVRLADPLIHPRVLGTAEGGLTPGMRPAFYLGILGALLLFFTLCRYEMANKHTRAQLRALKRRFGQDAPARAGRSSAPEVPAR